MQLEEKFDFWYSIFLDEEMLWKTEICVITHFAFISYVENSVNYGIRARICTGEEEKSFLDTQIDFFSGIPIDPIPEANIYHWELKTVFRYESFFCALIFYFDWK